MKNSISKIMSAKTVTFSAALLAIAAPAFAVGCSSAPSGTGSGTVTGTAVAYNRSTHALTAGSLTRVDGQYGAACTGHPNLSLWEINFDGTSTGLDPTVDSADGAACILTVFELDTLTAQYLTGSAIALAGTYAIAPSLFTPLGGGEGFYANAIVTPADFTTAFIVNVETSDDPTPVTPVTITAGMVRVATATQSGIAPPAYTQTNDLGVVEDPTFVVQSVSGGSTLTSAGQTGENYIITQAPFTPSFTADDNAFNTLPPTAFPATTPTFNAVDLIQTGETLPQTTTIIIQHVDDATGDRTYETFQYIFAR